MKPQGERQARAARRGPLIERGAAAGEEGNAPGGAALCRRWGVVCGVPEALNGLARHGGLRPACGPQIAGTWIL